MPASAENRYCPRCGLATLDAHCPRDGTATIARTTIDLNAMQFRPGDVLASRYRIVKLLGRGGYGAVFAAEHTGTGQPVALKLLASDPGQGGDENQRRFFREAAITAQLRHPNTVRVHDFGQAENGALFMALELIDGPTLAQKQREFSGRGKAMPEVAAIDMAIAVLRSLGEAHNAQLVHRDLKPANIMYAAVPGEEPVVKVLDFGIVRARDSSLTASGTALGTPEYMSPEQCSGEPMDGRSDLYSLGIILFECVTGRLPFVDENPLRVMMMQLSSPPPDVKLFARTPVSDGFVDIVMSVLAKNPNERFADAREMRAALEAARPTSVSLAHAGPASELVQTSAAKRPASDAIQPGTPETGAGTTVRARDAGSATQAHAVAPTAARTTAQASRVPAWFASRELRIAAAGAGGVLLLLGIFAGGYFFDVHKDAPPPSPPADSATDVAEEALEPVAAPPKQRFVPAPGGKSVRDATTRLTWQRDVPAQAQTQAQANHYCGALALDGRGWRLPKKDELLGLAEAISAEAFPDAPTAWFWTDSPYQGSATNAYGVDFDSSRAGPYDVTTLGRVRCVR